MVESKRVVVVGAGAAGLSAAYALRKKGIEVSVLEASDRAGGRMAGEVVDGEGGASEGVFHVDTGAQLFSSAHRTTMAMCRELGVELHSPVKRDAMRIFRNGKLHAVTPGNVLSGKVVSPSAVWQAIKLSRSLRGRRDDFTSGDYARLLDLDDSGDSLADFGRKHAGDDFMEQLAGPLVLSLTLSLPPRIGALYGALILWNGLLSGASAAPVFPRRGIGEFAQALAEACAADTELSTPVARIEIEGGRVRGVVAGGNLQRADAVICATTASVVPRLVPGLAGSVADALSRVDYSRCCHVAMGVEGRPLPPGQYCAILPADNALAVYSDSAVVAPDSAPPGTGVLHAFAAGDRAEELLAKSDEEAAACMMEEIRKFSPAVPRKTLFTRVYRWREAVCLAPPGMMSDMRKLRTEGCPGAKGLFLAGGYMNVPGVNGALASGIAAAEDAVRFVADQPAAG